MEGKFRDVAITAIAPAAWATTYVVTKELLPPNRPYFSAAVRALPLGLVILLWKRTLPSGHWWWKAVVLGMLNIGLFFGLLFVGAYLLPGGLASTLQSLSPLVVFGLAAIALGERVRPLQVVGALLGVAGVALLVLRAGVEVNVVGVLAALGSVLVSGLGFVLVKKWKPPVDLWTLTGWQLTAGGLVLLPLALLVEGPPPTLDGPAIGGYLWLALVGTGLAYVVWFRGLQIMSAGSTAIIGLLNPVIATLLGVLISHERFGWAQAVGMVLVFGGIVLGQRAPSPARTKGLGSTHGP